MKKKDNNAELVTRKILKDELSFLDVKFEDVDGKFQQIDKKFEEMDKNARGYRDEILTKLDGVMGEMQTIREDNTIGTYQTRELRVEVDNHEKRIRRLEKPSA